jgi:hypothetical protein
LDHNVLRSVPIPQSESDSFVKLMHVEVEELGDVLLALTMSGRVRFFDVKKLEFLFTSNEVLLIVIQIFHKTLIFCEILSIPDEMTEILGVKYRY